MAIYMNTLTGFRWITIQIRGIVTATTQSATVAIATKSKCCPYPLMDLLSAPLIFLMSTGAFHIFFNFFNFSIIYIFNKIAHTCTHTHTHTHTLMSQAGLFLLVKSLAARLLGLLPPPSQSDGDLNKTLAIVPGSFGVLSRYVQWKLQLFLAALQAGDSSRSTSVRQQHMFDVIP